MNNINKLTEYIKIPVLLSILLLNIQPTEAQIKSVTSIEVGQDSRNKFIPDYITPRIRSILQMPYNEGIDSINHLISDKSENTELFYYKAWCHYLNSQVFDAYEDINAYLRKPLHNEYYARVLLSTIHLTRMSRPQATMELDKALILDPGKVYAYIEKARIYTLTREVDDGLTFINKCITKFPNEGYFRLFRGDLLFESASPKKVIEDYNWFLKSSSNKNPADVSGCYMRSAKAHMKIKELNKSLELLDSALMIKPEFYLAYGLKGEAYYKLKMYEEALRNFNKMEEKSDNSEFWKIIAEIHEMNGDYEKACVYYEGQCKLFQNVSACSKMKKHKCNPNQKK